MISEPEWTWSITSRAGYVKLDNASWDSSQELCLDSNTRLIIDYDAHGNATGIEVLT